MHCGMFTPMGTDTVGALKQLADERAVTDQETTMTDDQDHPKKYQGMLEAFQRILDESIDAARRDAASAIEYVVEKQTELERRIAELEKKGHGDVEKARTSS